jgi:hypothetical protein
VFKRLLFFVGIQFFSLFSSNEFKQVHNNHKTSHIEMNVDNHQNVGRSNSLQISSRFIKTPDTFYRCPANYSIVADQGSEQLKNHFATVIAPMIFTAAIQNYYRVIPGYESPHGLRDCINELSQFLHSDKTIIENLTSRLNSYCERIENVLFNGKHSSFCHTLSPCAQIELVRIYADFLKEFCSDNAPYHFYNQSQKSSLMQNTMSMIDWRWYDGKDYKSNDKEVKQRYAAALNGSLGAVHKALHAGDSEKAYTIGQQRVVTAVSKIRKIETVASVFEVYPDVKKVVEQAYRTDKAKVEQARMAMQMAIKQDAVVVQAECKTPLVKKSGIAAMAQRCDAATRNSIDAQFFKKIHKVSSKDATHINSEHLTADRKGILIDGGHLQHHLVDEAISVVDTVTSCDLIENMQDAVIDLANVSLASNKDGDVITASRTLDVCWAIIDFAQDAARYAYTSLRPVVAGMVEGVGESLYGAVHVVCHPVEAAHELVNSFVTMGYCVGKMTYNIAEFSAVCDMVEMHPECVEQVIQEYSCDPMVFFAAYEQAKTISTQDAARVGTKTVADMMLLHGATKVVSAIAKESLPAFLSCMRKGAQSADLAITTEGIPVRCGEEVASLMGNVDKVSGGAGITATAIKIANQAPELLCAFKIANYDSSIGNLQKLEQAVERLKNVPGALTKDGALFKALEYGQKAEVLIDAKKTLEIKGRLATARGAMYEVEKTLELMEAGEEIIHLGVNIKGINATREFDIITSVKYIECKNIDWFQQTKAKIDRMCSIFAEQLKIAIEKGMIFEVHSKNPISSDMKAWFTKKSIQFFEG